MTLISSLIFFHFVHDSLGTNHVRVNGQIFSFYSSLDIEAYVVIPGGSARALWEFYDGRRFFWFRGLEGLDGLGSSSGGSDGGTDDAVEGKSISACLSAS